MALFELKIRRLEPLALHFDHGSSTPDGSTSVKLMEIDRGSRSDGHRTRVGQPDRVSVLKNLKNNLSHSRRVSPARAGGFLICPGISYELPLLHHGEEQRLVESAVSGMDTRPLFDPHLR